MKDIQYNKGNKHYRIDVHEGGRLNRVKILGDINFTWEDRRIETNNSNYFMRTIKNSTIYFLD